MTDQNTETGVKGTEVPELGPGTDSAPPQAPVSGIEAGATAPVSPAGEGAGEGGPSSPAAAPAPSTSGRWPKSAVDRVAKLTARLNEFKAREAGTAPPVNPQSGQPFTPAELDAIVQERAQILARQQTFNSACNSVADRGAQRFADWKPRLESLVQLVDSTDPRATQQYNLFLEAALETGKAEEIIHELGGDPDRASRLLAMSPVKMALEVGKMAAGPGPKPQPGSSLPRPIRPVGSSAPSSALRPDDPEHGADSRIEDWMKAREAQAKERRIR